MALPFFPDRPTDCRCRLDSPVDCQRQFSLVSSYEKDLVLPNEVFVLALPIFPGSRPPNIVGVHELNFCVRDGNRWTLMTINTNFCGWLLTISMSNAFASNALHSSTSSRACQALFQGLGDPYRIRTDVKGVRGLCLNHLTNGPWCTFTDSNRGPTD